jgi:transglutaminase-like putative cysteine protease
MRFRIHHRTTYSYASPVYESFNQVRLQPTSDESQTCLDFDLAIEPPATVIHYPDYFGSGVHDFGIPYEHDHLTITASSDVATNAGDDEPLVGPAPGEEDGSPPLAAAVASGAFFDELPEYLWPSRYVSLDDDSGELARELAAADSSTTVLGFVVRAGEAVADRLTYKLGTTRVDSTAQEVLALGSGVCQDYSHVLISLLRHAGIPARYVSGYLGTVAHATAAHAWVEAWVPPYGWVGFDATRREICTGCHVKIGVGRDYADVSVLRGTYQGGAKAELEVEVTSRILADDAVSMAGGRRRAHGRLVSFQNLTAVRQFEWGSVIAAGRQSPPSAAAAGASWPPVRSQRVHGDAMTSSQPQQQQQQQQAIGSGIIGPCI